jgi:hypothetical protein
MQKINLSTKRLAIDKANSTMLLAVGIAVFVVVFSLVSSKALLEQRSYQAKVITLKKKALDRIKTNADEVKKLDSAYREFAAKSPNVLEGNPRGDGDKDGDNPRIVLDALPSKYDFPAVATSLEKVLKNYQIDAITGTDDEVGQAGNQASGTPQPVDIPFSVTVDLSPQALKPFFLIFEQSIRPFQVSKVTISSSEQGLNVILAGKTYFQPEKTFSVQQEVISAKKETVKR